MEVNVRTDQIVAILGLWFIDDCTSAEKDFSECDGREGKTTD